MTTVIQLFANEPTSDLQRLQRELVLAHHILDREGQGSGHRWAHHRTTARGRDVLVEPVSARL